MATPGAPSAPANREPEFIDPFRTGEAEGFPFPLTVALEGGRVLLRAGEVKPDFTAVAAVLGASRPFEVFVDVGSGELEP